jgi:DNA-binding MarR family transcriptional regulator
MVATSALLEPRSEPNEIPRLIDLVHEVLKSSLRQLHPTLAKEGITMGQFWALHTVWSLQAASVSTVARYLGVSSPTVCSNIDQLEEAGLVRRDRSERDRRAVTLSLTPRGRKVEARVWNEVGRVIGDAARDLPPEDIAAAVRVFREIAARLDRDGPDGPEGP